MCYVLLFYSKYPSIGQVPFPAKKTFQNTQRSVLEHRMTLLNEFLKIICMRADDNDDLYTILRDFLEPDTNDKKIHGGAVIRTVSFLFCCFQNILIIITGQRDFIEIKKWFLLFYFNLIILTLFCM